MTEAQRERLFEKLLERDPPELRKHLVGIVTADIDAIAPIVDEWIKEAEARGRFGGILEIVARQHEERRKSGVRS